MAIPTIGSMALVTVDPATNGGQETAPCTVVRVWQENIPDPSYRPQDENDRAPLVQADLAAVIAFLSGGQEYLPRVYAAGSKADAGAIIDTHRALVPKVREGNVLAAAAPELVYQWAKAVYPAEAAAPASPSK